MDCGPIFIAGLERSGTTLLYALLASHPNIAMTRRMNFWKYFFNRFGPLNRPENLDRCLGAMMSYERIWRLGTDWQCLRAELSKGDPTYARLFAVLEEQHARRLGRSRWGDKSLDAERYAGVIFDSYPNAKMIHMIRDPRDRYASAFKSNRIGRGRAAAGIAAWLLSVTLAKQNATRHPQAYMVVRFESLVSNPEDTLKKTCQFIGEEYTPAMLVMQGASSFRDKGGNSSFEQHDPRSISTAPVGRFRRVLTPREVAFIQAFAGREMTRFSYTPEPVRLSLADRVVHCLFDWPLNLARVAGWHAVVAYKDRIGRMPSARRLVQ